MPAPAPAPQAYAAAAMDSMMEEAAPPVREVAAAVQQGIAAATYRPARPVAVPADGTAHRATVAVFDMESTLDYVTAPVLAEEAHLRATVTNSSPHTLQPGTASVFHGPDFVGSTKLETWAPGEETELALSRTGRDVGTPIITFRPPDGLSFFGPVISRIPSDEEAVRLWDAVIALAGFPGFAELKRSLRERPQLPAFGVEQGQVGTEEDWHAGSRRTRR